MNLTSLELLRIVLPILLLEGLFSGSEIALLSADKLKLKERAGRGSTRARLALELAKQPEKILATTLLVTSLCIVAISSMIALFFLSHGGKYAEMKAVLFTSPLIVLGGELLPKMASQRYADRLAPWVAYPVMGMYWIFFPVTRLISSYTSKLSRLLGPIEELLTGKTRSTREELRSMLSYGRRESELKASEKRMIKRIFDFKDSVARNALIPLVKVEAVDDSVTVREALERFAEHRHSRMPVFSERVDNIVGILELSDLAGLPDPSQPIRNSVTSPHYVAATQPLKDLMLEMRREDNEMVIVVDEYGGAVGILTFEDIVEEIVGEIHDEDDPTQSPYRPMEDGTWLVQARMEVAQINESLRLDIPEGEYETLGGFLLQQFGRIPEPGDELYFDTSQGTLKLTIRRATERQIESVIVERLER